MNAKQREAKKIDKQAEQLVMYLLMSMIGGFAGSLFWMPLFWAGFTMFTLAIIRLLYLARKRGNLLNNGD